MAVSSPRPMRSVDEQLALMGVPVHVRERWGRELARCTTMQQVSLTAECHRIEAHLYGRYGR